ncbi:hypothetical protein ABK040_003884 [Willaertia magna]
MSTTNKKKETVTTRENCKKSNREALLSEEEEKSKTKLTPPTYKASSLYENKQKFANDKEMLALIEKQEEIKRKQDKTLDRMLDSIHRVKGIALDISDELDTHKGLLNDIEVKVEDSKDKLTRMNKKIDKIEENFILDNKIFKNRSIPLTEKLPNYLFKLKYLNIDNKQLNNNLQLLSKFKNVQKIKFCGLPENFIFMDLPLLEELVISHSTLQKETLINLKQLKYLHFLHCKLNDDCLNYLNNLEELKFRNCKEITGECLQNFKKLSTLQVHRENKNNFVNYIEDLINLKYLLIHCLGSLNNPNFMKNIINLEYLSIDLEYVPNKNIKYLENIKYLNNLKTFNVYGDGEFSSLGEYERYFSNLTNLTELRVNYIYDFSGICLLNLINLEKLNISSTEVIDEYLLNLNKLKELNISNCRNIKGNCLKNMNCLTTLHIESRNNINYESLLGLTNLKTLNCAHNSDITDEYYLMNLKKLTTLNVSNCENITGKCFVSLTNVTELRITDSKNIDKEYLKNLVNIRDLR